MRIFKHELKKPLQVIGIICSMMLMVSLIGCSKTEDPSGMPDVTLKSKIEVAPVVHFTGATHFLAYTMNDGVEISPWELNQLPCEATLTHIGGQDYLLETVEYVMPDMAYRTVTYEVKMTPAGSLKFYWPETWEELDFNTWEMAPNTMSVLEQINLHTGVTLYGGPGLAEGTILYQGYFNGTTFFADMNLIGKQEVLGAVEPFWTSLPLIEGPIRIAFSIELEVAE